MTLEKSQTLSWLIEEANKRSNLNKSELLTLLNLINAPANLHVLFLALKNLPSVLANAKDLQDADNNLSPDVNLSSAITTCEILLKAKGSLSKNAALAGLFPDPHLSAWKQLHGILKSYPLYSCLCFQPNNDVAKKVYQQLLTQVLLASQAIESSGKELSDLSDNFFSVRKLTESKFEKQLLTLPVNPIPPLDYLAATKRSKANSHTRIAGLILQRAYADARKSKGSKVTSRTQASRKRPDIEDLEDYENPGALWTGENFITKELLTRRRAQQYSNHGGSTAEFTGGRDDVPVPMADERAYSGPTLRELAFQGKQRSNQEAMKNQFNPLGWNELNEYDIHILHKFLQEDTSSVTTGQELSFLRDCLNLMFWLSAPLDRILKLKKFNGPPPPNSGDGLYLKNDRTLLARLHSPGPPLESTTINTASKLAYPIKYYCHIPLPLIAHSETLVAACRNASGQESQLPQPVGLEDDYFDSIKKQAKAELNNLNGIFGTRLSLGRISHYWLHTLGMELNEDLPSSMLFFGHLDKFSVARIHYTCAPAQRMETTYRRICSELLQELDLQTDFPEETLVNTEIYLGTPFCPKPESIQALVKSLQDAIEQSRPTKKQLSSIKNFHNHYAVYTASLIAFATTYRAVIDPSFYEKDIHFATGMGVISDKDDEAFYHSRFVWIAEVCRQQIIFYRRHLQRLYESFGIKSPALFNLFKSHDMQGRPLDLFFIPRHNKSLKILRPGLLEKLLKKGHQYDLPANANRHYLKTELLKSGCSPDIIEAQLGHWEKGQEPWNRFSNLHPREFCKQLELHISPILERDGWMPIKGYNQ